MKIFLVGPPGAGKSTIGRQLSRLFDVPFYDVDEVVEARAGADIPWIFDVEGEQGFRDRESAVIAELAGLSEGVIATGGGVILREGNRRQLSGAGAVVYLEASIKTLVNRTSRNNKRPLLAGPDPKAKLVELMSVREPLYQEVATLTIKSGGTSAKHLAGLIHEQLQAAVTTTGRDKSLG